MSAFLGVSKKGGGGLIRRVVQLQRLNLSGSSSGSSSSGKSFKRSRENATHRALVDLHKKLFDDIVSNALKTDYSISNIKSSNDISDVNYNNNNSHSSSSSKNNSKDDVIVNIKSDGPIISTSTSSNSNSSNVVDLSPPRGTRDFYPSDQKLKQWLFSKWRKVAESYGYEEYDAPVVESTGLYTRKGGDDIVDQLYCFQDKSGRNLSLRPEMTPSLARMVMATHANLSFPIKWYSIPQCWRYERTSKGRRREHYQLNMDIWGSKSIEADAEVLSVIVSLLKELGLNSSDVGLQVSNRKVIDSLMNKFDFPKDHREKCFNIIDKLDKSSLDEMIKEFSTIGVSAASANEFLNVLKMDVDQIKQVLGGSDENIIELDRLFHLCKLYGIDDWITFNASIVRGLSYYSGTVFEGFDRKKTLRAICGGGRYDNLLTSLGYNHSIPAVGFGFGDAVIMELLKEKKLLPDFHASSSANVFVYAYEGSLLGDAMKIATELRSIGFKVDMNIEESKKVKWVLQRANKLGIDHVILISSEEMKSSKVIVRDMKKNSQAVVGMDKLRSHFQQIGSIL